MSLVRPAPSSRQVGRAVVPRIIEGVTLSADYEDQRGLNQFLKKTDKDNKLRFMGEVVYGPGISGERSDFTLKAVPTMCEIKKPLCDTRADTFVLSSCEKPLSPLNRNAGDRHSKWRWQEPRHNAFGRSHALRHRSASARTSQCDYR